MSTKIYNGYRLPMLSTMELHQFIGRVKAEVKQKKMGLYTKVLANHIARELDELKIFGLDQVIEVSLSQNEGIWLGKGSILKSLRPLRKIHMELAARYKKSIVEGQLELDVDFDFEVALFPQDNQILAIPFVSNKEMMQIWESQPEVSSYGYWDNVDPEEGVSDEEWEQRKVEWMTIAGLENKTPGEAGMVVEINKGFPEFYNLEYKQIEEAMPPFESRLKEITYAKVYDNKYKELRKEAEDESKIMTLYREVNKWMRTDEGKAEQEKIQAEIRDQLFPVITEGIMWTEYQELAN